MRAPVLVLCGVVGCACGVSQDDGFPVTNQSGGTTGAGTSGGFSSAVEDAGVDAGPLDPGGGSGGLDGGSLSGGGGPGGGSMPLNEACRCTMGHLNPTNFFERLTLGIVCGARICGQNDPSAFMYGCDTTGRPTIDVCLPQPRCTCQSRDGMTMMCGTFVCSVDEHGVERAWECDEFHALRALPNCPVPAYRP